MSLPKIGVLNISDRASAGIYSDEPGQACVALLRAWLTTAFDLDYKIIPDDQGVISAELIRMADVSGCGLIVTTGGTGPAPRDVTPEATRAVIEKELPGFGELMRATSLNYVPTAILSRQLAGTRGRIRENFEAVFPAIPYGLDLIGAARLETNAEVMKSFRPKT